MNLLPDSLIPQWPAPPQVRAVCTTRAGGLSGAPYDSLNLGDHVGDDPVAVRANRARLQQAIATRPVFLSQVHGSAVVQLTATTPDGTQADACYTRERGLACTIMVADCLPVLLTDVAGSFVAAAHAGWRGLAGPGAGGGAGVLEALCASLPRAAGAPVPMAWLGPCIGPGAFEVGTEVRAAFVAHDARAADWFAPGRSGKWLADLAGLARQRLVALGITQVFGNDGSAAWCTVSNAGRYFSHRHDRVSGRMAACVWLT